MDWMLENPQATLGDCARAMNVTQSYLSVVINSDAFKDRFNARREEHNAGVSKSVIERVEELAGTALEVLNERIAAERANVGLGAVTDAAEIALKALGFGGSGKASNGNGNFNQSNTTNNNVFVLEGASRDTLAAARADMRALNGGTPHMPPPPIEIEHKPTTAPKSDLQMLRDFAAHVMFPPKPSEPSSS